MNLIERLRTIPDPQASIGVQKLGRDAADALCAAREGLLAVQALIEDSQGVYGLHLNGDPSPWEELLTGGRFEDWLRPFDDSLKALPAATEAA